MDNLRLWHKFLETIKPNISSANFRTFFSKTLLKEVNEDKIVLTTASAFIKETLNQRHLPLVESTFAGLLNRKVAIELQVKGSAVNEHPQTEEDFFQPIQTQSTQLNQKYTLENFVVGPSNNLAYAAAEAVVQNPGISYNPLFVYGGTGVGKTHLMLGIDLIPKSITVPRKNLPMTTSRLYKPNSLGFSAGVIGARIFY